MIEIGKRHGQSLVAVIITGAVISAALTSLVHLFTKNKIFNATQDRRVITEQVMSDVGTQLMEFTWGEIEAFCKDKLGAPVDGKCILGNQLNTPNGISRDVYCKDAPRRPLELVRDVTGICNPTGILCVELRKCDYIVADALLEIQLRGYWVEPTPDRKVAFRDQVMRKASW